MELDLIFKIAAVGIIVAVLNQILKKTDHDEQAMMLTVAGLVIVLMMLIPAIDELFGTIRSVFGLWSTGDAMDITTLVGIAVLSAVLCIIVRQYKPEMALGISIACGVLIMGAVITMLAPSVELISQLTGAAGLDGGYSRTLFKALAEIGRASCRERV